MTLLIKSRYATENSYRYVLRPIKCSRINTFLCIEVPAGGSDFYHTGIFDREVSPRSGRSVVIGRAGGNKKLKVKDLSPKWQTSIQLKT